MENLSRYSANIKRKVINLHGERSSISNINICVNLSNLESIEADWHNFSNVSYGFWLVVLLTLLRLVITWYKTCDKNQQSFYHTFLFLFLQIKTAQSQINENQLSQFPNKFKLHHVTVFLQLKSLLYSWTVYHLDVKTVNRLTYLTWKRGCLYNLQRSVYCTLLKCVSSITSKFANNRGLVFFGIQNGCLFNRQLIICSHFIRSPAALLFRGSTQSSRLKNI